MGGGGEREEGEREEGEREEGEGDISLMGETAYTVSGNTNPLKGHLISTRMHTHVHNTLTHTYARRHAQT